MEPAISSMSSPATSKTLKSHICSTKTVDPAIKRQASSLATSKVDLSVKQLASSRSSLRRPLTSRHHSFLRRHGSVTGSVSASSCCPLFFWAKRPYVILGASSSSQELLQLPHGPSPTAATAEAEKLHHRLHRILVKSNSTTSDFFPIFQTRDNHSHFRSRHHAQDAAQPLRLWQHRLARNSPPRLRCTESKCGLLTSRFVQSGHLRRLLAQDPCAGSSRPVEWPRRCD